MQIQGKVVHIYEAERKSDKFTVQEFVLQTADKFPQTILFQLSNDRVGKADSFLNGEAVVHFDVQGRKWQDPKTGKSKVFNTLSAWKVEAPEGSVLGAPQQFAQPMPAIAAMPTPMPSNDLPF